MKFRFCGDHDCPDWILQEVAVLSKMSSVRMMLILRQIKLVLLGKPVDYDKLKKLTTGPRLNFSASDIKAMIAALSFILRNSAKYTVDGATVLPLELQQLGLPMDIVKAICKCYVGCQAELRAHFQSQAIHMPRLESAEWRVDYLLSSSFVSDLAVPEVRLQLNLSRPVDVTGKPTVGFTMSEDKFRVLFNDLKMARAIMDRT